MDSQKIIDAIRKINPDAEVSIRNNDINDIVWENGTTPISKSDIEVKQAALVIQEEADATAKANRLVSVKGKLEALGLTTEEVKDAFGL